MVVTLIIPTQSHAQRWAQGWVLDALRAQTEPPDALVIACDHCEDDTLGAITANLTRAPVTFTTTILDLTAPPAKPFPASGYADNCLIHFAGDGVLLHLDDDIQLPPDYTKATREHFRGDPHTIVWGHIRFVDAQGNTIQAAMQDDCRHYLADKRHWPTLPGGLCQMPNAEQLHWGAVWSVQRRDLIAIGGHDLADCGYHNQDTKLGNRLARSLAGSYITRDPALTCLHFDRTWHSYHAQDIKAQAAAYNLRRGPIVANGGPGFWSSPWFAGAYQIAAIIPPLTSGADPVH